MTMIQQLATNLTKFEGEAMNPRGPSLGNTINKLEATVETQNDSILENSAQLSQLQTDLSVVQNVIQTQVSVIEKLEGNYIAGNATANDHSLRIAILESEQTVNRYTFYNHTDKFELLEKNLNDQNSSVQRVSEKVLKLNSEHEFDRNLVKELKASVRLIEDNITTQAVILQNYSSYLNEFGHEMTLISEMIQLQHKDHEQLKENMTDHERNSFVFDERLYKLEARSNTSEIVLVDYHNRLGQVELKHISEIAVNEEQESQIRVLVDEMNQTWIAIQGFSERSADPIGKRCSWVFEQICLVCVINTDPFPEMSGE